MFRLMILVLFAVAFAGCEGAGDGGISDPDVQDDDETVDDDDADGDDDDFDDDSGFQDDDNGDDDEDDTEIDTENICDEWDIEIVMILTRLMFLQDASSSMDQGTPSKWEQAVAALTTVLENFNDRIEFGLDSFPNTEGCGVADPVHFDTEPENGQAIIDALPNIPRARSTPLFLGMQAFLDTSYAPNFTDPDVSKYLVVISDGAGNCGPDGQMGGNETPEELGALTKQLLDDLGVMTFAIGFGSEASPAQLNAIAQNGGTPFTQYIDAQDQAELEAAFDEIASIVVSCTYDIGEPDGNVDMDEVNFYFDYGDGSDPEVVPYDEDCAQGIGWTWVNDEKTQVLFCEEACEKLKSGIVKEISATYGCDTIVV